jgi:hypothetical protein
MSPLVFIANGDNDTSPQLQRKKVGKNNVHFSLYTVYEDAYHKVDNELT